MVSLFSSSAPQWKVKTIRQAVAAEAAEARHRQGGAEVVHQAPVAPQLAGRIPDPHGHIHPEARHSPATTT